MTDDGRRAEEHDQEAAKQSSEPKPASRERRHIRWADIEDNEKELNDFKQAKKALMELKNSRGQCDWSNQVPGHWKDLVHDEDGGYDMFGRRAQDGRLQLKQELAKLAFANGKEWAQDDVSGVELDPKMVREARKVEMTFFKKMKVYTRVPRAMQKMKEGKIIGVRW